MSSNAVRIRGSVTPSRKEAQAISGERYIKSAPTPDLQRARIRVVKDFASAARVSLSEGCELVEKADCLVENLTADVRRHVQTAAALRDCADLLNALSSSGGRVRRATAAQCDALAAELAAELVKKDGPLRAAVTYLLAHPPQEI
jgi:hypothetical protein